MKKDWIFFAQDGGAGLTSTSANHVANLAKEMVRGIETKLKNLAFYSESVGLIGSQNMEQTRIGSTLSDLEAVKTDLFNIGKANSLIAWLREGIKAKERLVGEAENLSLEDYAKLKNIELPKPPERKAALTEDEFFASLGVNERNRYYELQAYASVLGNAIHPGGSFAEARDSYMTRLEQPRAVVGEGRDTLIYVYTPTVESTEIESTYFELQNRYREAQSKLNAMKFECQRACKESAVAVSREYEDKAKDFNNQMVIIRAEMTTYVKDEVRRLGNLKIIIPDSLKDIYTAVSTLGKKQ